jgi:YVTN family beta-propeller protein
MGKLFRLFILFIFSLIISTGCSDKVTDQPPSVDENNNGFASYKVASIFADNCATAGCHKGPDAANNLSLETYSDLMRGSIGRPFNDTTQSPINKNTSLSAVDVYGGESVIPYHPEQSLLYNLITGNVTDSSLIMPSQNAPLSNEDIQAIKDWIADGAKDFNGNVPFSIPDNKVYSCNQGSDQVYIIDTDAKVVSGIVNADFNSTIIDAPHNVQISGGYYYFTEVAGQRFIKVDAATNMILGMVEGIEKAGMIQITADGSKAYVSRSSTSAPIYNIIYAVNTAGMQIEKEINLPVTGVPHALALSHNNRYLYVANMTKDRISIVDAVTDEFVDDIVLQHDFPPPYYEPMHMYISPDDKYLYVNCRTSSSILIVDLTTGSIVKEFPVPDHPMQGAVSDDGTKYYAVSHHEPYLSEITKNGTDWTIHEYQIDAFQHAYGADLSPDGKYLFVGCSNDNNEFQPRYPIPGKDRPSIMCIYDVQNHELVKVLDIGSYATGIAAR